MPIAPKIFEGQTIYQPGVYTSTNYMGTPSDIGVLSNVVAVVGTSVGGIPYNANVNDNEKVNIITSVNDALNKLKGGNGYYMCEFFLTPTRDETLRKPSQVLFFRVNPATKSYVFVKDSSNNNVIKVSSLDYGEHTNNFSKKISNGTIKGKKIEVNYAGQNVFSADNIDYECFDIKYNGTGTTCELSITSTQLVITSDESTDNITLDFSQYDTIGKIVSFISSRPNYTCVLKGNIDKPSNELDIISNVDIKTNTYTTKANVQAIIDAFNSSGIVLAELVGSRTNVQNDATFTYFSGGTTPTPTITDWINTFALMERFNINHILVASGDPLVHSLASNHCNSMSNVNNKKNRTWASGASLNKTKSQKIAEAKALNDPRGIYFVTPIKRFDYINNGVVKVFDPFFAAAFDAGIRYANNITISSTFKKPNILGINEDYSNMDKDDYIKNGCSLISATESNEYEITHCITTYQGNNLILNLPSMLRTADYITLDSQFKIKNRIASLDRAPNSIVIKSIENYLITNLLQFYKDNGFLTDDPYTGLKAFSNVSFRLQGDVFYFEFTGILPAPLHYVFVKQNFSITGNVS
jgi:hypothetical protein